VPIKGIIFIFLLATLTALYYHEQIYSWLSSEMSDDDNKDEEKQEEDF